MKEIFLLSHELLYGHTTIKITKGGSMGSGTYKWSQRNNVTKWTLENSLFSYERKCLKGSLGMKLNSFLDCQ